MAWILGGGAAVGMAMVAASLGACSSSPNPTTDAGKDVTTTDTGTNKDTGTTDTGTPDTGIQDAGADCKTVPSSFPFSTPDAGPFCPFMASADGGTTFADCNLGEHCCVYPTSASKASTCNQANQACVPGGADSGTVDFTCQETADCTGSDVCCLGSPAYLSQDPGCTSYHFVSKFGGSGTYCRTACATGEVQICGSNADCPTGKTCQPVNTKGIWIGACQ